jgi:hypothetical protein
LANSSAKSSSMTPRISMGPPISEKQHHLHQQSSITNSHWSRER